MTVSSSTSRADYNGNGVTVAFTVPFYFLDESHLAVYSTDTTTGVTTTLAITTDYTVTGAGSGSGGTVTMLVAPAVGKQITVLRSVPLNQLARYVENSPFPARSHESALDKLTMAVQQQQELIDRALKLPVADGATDDLAAAADRQDHLLGFNASTGAPEMTSFTQADVARALSASSLGGGAVTEQITLEDFGGSPALADNKAAFDAAIASGYSPIYLKADTYITSPLTLDRRVKFQCSSGPLGTSVQRKAEIKLKNSSATHLFTYSGDSAKLLLENISLNGNKQNQSLANCGIYAPDATAWTESVELVASHVRNCKGSGIRLGQNRNRLHALLRSYIAENDGYGVWSVGALDHKFADSEIGDNGLTNLYIDGTVTVQAANMVMTNTEVYHGGLLGTSEGHNVYIGGRCSEFTWLGGDCLRAERNGVHIAQLLLATPSAISIHGVRFSANSHSVTNTYSDIFDDRGGCAFFGLKHQPAAGVLPKYLYEIGPNSVRPTMAFGALHIATSYGTAFTDNNAKLVAMDDLRARYPTDHPGLQFLHSSASNPLLAAFSSTTGQTLFSAQAGGTLFWGGGAGAVDTALFRQQADLLSVGATDAVNARTALWLTDGVAAQFAEAGFAKIFIDVADGDLKVRFGDGTLKTIVTNP